MPRKAKAKAASPDAGEAADTAEAQDSDTPDAAEAGAGGLGPIMPLVRVDGEWWIDASELCEDEPIWGPYSTKAEANEDRRPSFVRRVREQRRALTRKRKSV